MAFRSVANFSRASTQIGVLQTRNMASLADLKNRMEAIKSIRKITSSLKQVATAKLKSSQNILFKGRPYYEAATSVLLDKMSDNSIYGDKYRHLVVACTADKGLCGSVNSVITKQVKKMCGLEGGEKQPGVDISIATVGAKGKSQLGSKLGKQFTISVDNTSRRGPMYNTCVLIADALTEFEYDKITIIHNRFVNVLAFKQQSVSMCSKEIMREKVTFYDFQFEGEQTQILDNLYNHTLAAILYNAMIENNAVEIAKRMTSMDGATKAANDMLSALSLQYNRQRQAKITNELIEITSGAQAVKEMMEE